MLNNFVIQLSLLSCFISFVLIKNSYRICKYFSLFDVPDKKRKIHNKPIPLFGGILFITFSLFLIFYSEILNDIETKRILFFSLIVSIIGILDDKYGISANLRLLIIAFIIFFFIKSYPEFIISNLKIATFGINIMLPYRIAEILTILCILLLINSFNMADGVNGLAISIFIVWLALITNFFKSNILIIYILIPSLFFLIQNIKGKIFLGDSGTYFLSTTIALLTIYFYNSENTSNLNSIEIIYILFAFIGIDMLRLFLVRIFKGKNPFHPDLNHFHHLLLKKGFSANETIMIYVLSIAFFFIIANQNYIEIYLIILIQLLIYIFAVILLQRSK